MRAFFTIWVGQLVSLLGSAMTGFGLSIWLFQQTGRAETLTWALVCFIAPNILLSPIAGAIVDRVSRKRLLILSDTVSGLTTAVLFLLLRADALEIWHIYLLNFVSGAFNSLQFPAFSAAITLLVRKEDYGRAGGFISLADALSGILAPALAAVLLSAIGLSGLMLIDLITFLAAIGTLALVAIPSPQQTVARDVGVRGFWRDTVYGFRYILARPSLLGLQLVFMGLNFFAFMGLSLTAAYVLARSGNNELTLGSVQSVGASGGIAGALLMGIWGGPRKKVHGVLGGIALGGLSGIALMGVGRVWLAWAIAAFCLQFCLPFINGSNQAIWQAKVAPAVQGRVFSARRLIGQVMAPLAAALSGPLADRVLEPSMAVGGRLTPLFGRLVGVGPGAGMGLLMVAAGLLSTAVALIAYTVPAVRDAEARLPDHAESATQPAA